MFSDALCLGHGTATDADRRRGPIPRPGCSLHSLVQICTKPCGKVRVGYLVVHRHCRRRPVDVFAPVSRDETIGAGQVMPAKVITTGPLSPSSSSSESPTRATRTVLVPLISIERSSQIARSIPVNVGRLTMLPALDNHDAAPPSCHRRVVHN